MKQGWIVFTKPNISWASKSSKMCRSKSFEQLCVPKPELGDER